MMMKTIAALLLSAVLLSALTACREQGETEQTTAAETTAAPNSADDASGETAEEADPMFYFDDEGKLIRVVYTEYTLSDYVKLGDYGNITALEYDPEDLESKTAAINDVWSQVVAGCTILGYPEQAVNDYITDSTTYYTYSALYSGYSSLEDMLSEQYGMDMTQFSAQLAQYAQSSMSEDMILFSIVDQEGITLTSEEVDTRAAGYAAAQGYATVAELEANYDKDVIIQSALWDVTLEYLLDLCTK